MKYRTVKDGNGNYINQVKIIWIWFDMRKQRWSGEVPVVQRYPDLSSALEVIIEIQRDRSQSKQARQRLKVKKGEDDYKDKI